jgi:hypothetical protein
MWLFYIVISDKPFKLFVNGEPYERFPLDEPHLMRQNDIDLGNVKMHRKKDIQFDIQINMFAKWRYSSN